MENFTIAATSLTPQQVSDILCSAFEGGSGYWATLVDLIEPSRWEFSCDPDRHYDFDYALNPGGEAVFKDREDPTLGLLHLNREAVQRGLEVMEKRYAYHFANILTVNADAITGDVLLQCCLLGEIVYG